MQASSPDIGVVIPTLNEASTLPVLLDRLTGIVGLPADRIVVADCESPDGTRGVAERAGVKALTVDPFGGRGGALGAGIAALRSTCPEVDVVWMLHADTLPPDDAVDAIGRGLSDPEVQAGAFNFRIDTRGAGYIGRRALRTVQFVNRQRCRRSHIYFGDQGIFVRASALDAIEGLPDRPILEDVALCERLIERFGKPAVVLLPDRMTTSARRFLRHGPIRQGLHDLAILTSLRWFGSAERLVERYNRDNAVPQAG